jgi:hypothetical protein
VLGFELLVRWKSEQLAFGKAALFEETAESGSRNSGHVLARRRPYFALYPGSIRDIVYLLKSKEAVL